jgi:DNA ligase (NAD+)
MFIPFNEIIECLTYRAKEHGYPIDGLVFKFTDIEYGKSLGQTSHHFKNAMAYKFYDEVATSTLISIDWTMGRTGVLTPVAVFEPIELEGSTINRASLHNISIMEELSGGFERVGDTLHIFKANQIIPQISKWEHNDEYSEETHLNIPEECPICGGKTEIRKEIDTKVLVCSNSNCEGKLINKLEHFCGKKGLDIKGLSKATLEKLIDWGWVNEFKDLFTLKEHRAEWLKRPGFGVKSVDNILNAIENGKNCELSNFIASLGIPLIGSTASKDLAKRFGSWNNFIEAVESNYHFWDIPNFGWEMHSAIVNYDYNKAKELYDNYLIINKVEVNESQNNLEGLVFVITGKVNKYKNRDELKAFIESQGGKVAGSISSKTNYLINNDVNSNSSKNVSAKKLGVPIVSEEDFLKILEKNI